MKKPFNAEVAKDFRNKYKLKNKDIASALNKGEDTVKQMFRQKVATPDNLDKLGNLLDIEVEYLDGSRLRKPSSQAEYDSYKKEGRIDKNGNIIPHYSGTMKKQKARLEILQDYLVKLGERGIEHPDSGKVYNWSKAIAMEKCNDSFEFRLLKHIRGFLEQEGFYESTQPKEARIIEGDE